MGRIFTYGPDAGVAPGRVAPNMVEHEGTWVVLRPSHDHVAVLPAVESWCSDQRRNKGQVCPCSSGIGTTQAG